MNIEEHVLSKELARNLWDKGVKVEDSAFVWYEETPINKDYNGVLTRTELDTTEFYGYIKKRNVPYAMLPAPMLSELLNLMPEPIEHKNINDMSSWRLTYLNVESLNEYTFAYYTHSKILFVSGEDPKAVDAVSKTLLWLIDNGYKPEEL